VSVVLGAVFAFLNADAFAAAPGWLANPRLGFALAAVWALATITVGLRHGAGVQFEYDPDPADQPRQDVNRYLLLTALGVVALAIVASAVFGTLWGAIKGAICTLAVYGVALLLQITVGITKSRDRVAAEISTVAASPVAGFAALGYVTNFWSTLFAGLAAGVSLAEDVVRALFSMLFQNYFRFSGRLGRREFWCGAVVIVVIRIFPLGIFDPVVSTISDVFTALSLCALASAGVRRLHDIGRSGAYVLLYVLPALLRPATLIASFIAPGAFGRYVGMSFEQFALVEGVAGLALLGLSFFWTRRGDPQTNAYGPPVPFAHTGTFLQGGTRSSDATESPFPPLDWGAYSWPSVVAAGIVIGLIFVMR